MLDYGALPPEVNSARMYAGPGSAPMMAAASAWNALAAELTSTAAAYDSVISTLANEEWMGPASASMAAAATPYITWMNATAAQAQQAATQASAAAAAFEAAHGATVPPPVIAANKAQLAALVATNVLGQNSAAIAANQAHYGQMWAQDAGAMYGYAASSAAAAQVTPFTEPNQTANPAGIAGQSASSAVGGNAQVAQLISAMPSALQGLSSPLTSTPPALATALPSVGDMVNVVLNGVSSGASTAAMYIPSTLLPSMIGYLTGPGFNAAGGGAAGAGIGALLAPGGPLSALGAMGGGAAGAASAASAINAVTPGVSAGMGQASLVGSLSAPSSWAAATPGATSSVAAQGSGWSAAPESNSVTAMPGGMPGAGAGRGSFGFGTPRYGFKPTVMPRPVMVG